MKNIEGLSKNKNVEIPLKLDFLVRETNQLLRANLQNNELLEKIKENFDKMIKYAKFFIKKIKTEKDFEEFMVGFEKILKEIEIEKLYNNTTIHNLPKFAKLDLFKQFFYISTPLYNNSENINLIKGGTCYNWAIFFYNLFNEIDRKNLLEKKLISFGDKYKHSAFLVGFKGKKYLIDPYAKKNGLITEVKKGNKVYLGAVLGELIFGEIVDEEKLELENGKEKIKSKIYKTIPNFIKSINHTDILNIKTYVNGEATQLAIKDLGDSFLINFDGSILQREKMLMEDSIAHLFLEENNQNNYKILLAIIGVKEDLFSQKARKKLKAISKKIDFDYLLDKLGLKDIIEMFKSF